MEDKLKNMIDKYDSLKDDYDSLNDDYNDDYIKTSITKDNLYDLQKLEILENMFKKYSLEKLQNYNEKN